MCTGERRSGETARIRSSVMKGEQVNWKYKSAFMDKIHVNFKENFSKKSFCPNPGVKVKIIQISLTFRTSLLTYYILFEVTPLRLRLHVGELIVAEGSSIKVWKWTLSSRPWTSVTSSHFTTSSGTADSEGEADFVHLRTVCLTFYPQNYLWWSTYSWSNKWWRYHHSPPFDFNITLFPFFLRRAVHHDITEKQPRLMFFFYFWQHQKVMNAL